MARLMKKIGVVGGLGPESTVDYYTSLIARYRECVDDGSYPCIIINSINLKRLVDWATAGDFESITDYLVEAAKVLTKAGADFALISANTPHMVFDEVSRRSKIPLISIVETACAAAKAEGRMRLGLFGTRYTMQGRFYPDVFSREGIALVVPEESEQDWIHEKYFGELIKGVFLPETRDGLLAIVERMHERDGIDGLLLAGTELPLIIRQESHNGVPFLDTGKIHVDKAIEELLSD